MNLKPIWNLKVGVGICKKPKFNFEFIWFYGHLLLKRYLSLNLTSSSSTPVFFQASENFSWRQSARGLAFLQNDGKPLFSFYPLPFTQYKYHYPSTLIQYKVGERWWGCSVWKMPKFLIGHSEFMVVVTEAWMCLNILGCCLIGCN